MTPAGLAAIEAAKACGSWDALTAVESMTGSPGIAQGHRRQRARQEDTGRHSPTSQRKQFLYYLASAKRAETRQKRIGEIVSFAARKITPGQAYEARRRQRADTM